MSTIYRTDISYEELIKNNALDIRDSVKIVYSVPHKTIHDKDNCLFIFKNEDGMAFIERYAWNKVDDILNKVLELYPNNKITWESTDVPWPECEGW